MRACPAVMHAEAVGSISALRRRPRGCLVGTHRPVHSFALAVRVEVAPNDRSRTANRRWRSLGVGANNHATWLRHCGVRDSATNLTPVHDLRGAASTARLRVRVSWCNHSSNTKRHDDCNRSHVIPLWPAATLGLLLQLPDPRRVLLPQKYHIGIALIAAAKPIPSRLAANSIRRRRRERSDAPSQMCQAVIGCWCFHASRSHPRRTGNYDTARATAWDKAGN